MIDSIIKGFLSDLPGALFFPTCALVMFIMLLQTRLNVVHALVHVVLANAVGMLMLFLVLSNVQGLSEMFAKAFVQPGQLNATIVVSVINVLTQGIMAYVGSMFFKCDLQKSLIAVGAGCLAGIVVVYLVGTGIIPLTRV